MTLSQGEFSHISAASQKVPREIIGMTTELLHRAFKRGVKSVLAHHLTRRQLRKLQHNVYSQYLLCGTQTQYIPCVTHRQRCQSRLSDTHERGLQQHLPCGTAKPEAESEDTKNAETPVATQQTRAILHSELGDHLKQGKGI